MCVGRRREEKEPGIQNKKQEPHTKMWGTRTPHKDVGNYCMLSLCVLSLCVCEVIVCSVCVCEVIVC